MPSSCFDLDSTIKLAAPGSIVGVADAWFTVPPSRLGSFTTRASLSVWAPLSCWQHSKSCKKFCCSQNLTHNGIFLTFSSLSPIFLRSLFDKLLLAFFSIFHAPSTFPCAVAPNFALICTKISAAEIVQS